MTATPADPATHLGIEDPDHVEVMVDAGLAAPAADMHCWAISTLAQLGRVGEQVCIRVVDAHESRLLNRQYRGIDKPTNVLSFRADVTVPGQAWLGDIAICAPVAAAEAAGQHKAEADHYAHLVVHGLLHLLGYDHDTAAEADAMEAVECRLLEDLGVADPYRTADDAVVEEDPGADV